jgi:hypothetical protein
MHSCGANETIRHGRATTIAMIDRPNDDGGGSSGSSNSNDNNNNWLTCPQN